MKAIIRFRVFTTLLLVIVLLSACQKKKWKKPAHVSCSFQVNNSSTGMIQIHYANLTVEEINFDGKRKQGEKNISFDKKYETGAGIYTPYYQPIYTSLYQFYYQSYYQYYISQTNSQESQKIEFDIPQGTYTEINLNLKLSSFSSNKSLVLNGTFTNSFPIPIKTPVVFTLDASENIMLISKSANGGSEIVFEEGKTYEAKVNFDPSYWFASVSQSMLQSANLTAVGWGWGNNVMYINKTNNTNIYDIIVGRIKDGNEVVFN